MKKLAFVTALLFLMVATPSNAAPKAEQFAFLHEPHSYHHGSHHGGCFVTTSPGHHSRGIRHWRNPCPHHHRKHLNPYHPPHHRMRH